MFKRKNCVTKIVKWKIWDESIVTNLMRFPIIYDTWGFGMNWGWYRPHTPKSLNFLEHIWPSRTHQLIVNKNSRKGDRADAINVSVISCYIDSCWIFGWIIVLIIGKMLNKKYILMRFIYKLLKLINMLIHITIYYQPSFLKIQQI